MLRVATWRGRGYMLARFLVGLRGSTSSGPSRPCSMAGARRRQLRGARSSSSSTPSPAPSQSAWLLQRPSPVASSTSSKVATVGAAAAASGPNTPACSAVDARRSVAPRECMSMSILMSHRPISTSTVMRPLWARRIGFSKRLTSRRGPKGRLGRVPTVPSTPMGSKKHTHNETAPFPLKIRES